MPALRAPPGMRLMDPAELTLGALIGEGGFGKARGYPPPHSPCARAFAAHPCMARKMRLLLCVFLHAMVVCLAAHLAMEPV